VTPPGLWPGGLRCCVSTPPRAVGPSTGYPTLARVLRLPGTANLKDPANPKEIVVHSCTDARYNLSDFVEYLDDAAVPDQEAQEKAARDWSERFADKPLVIAAAARIPQDVLDGWMDGWTCASRIRGCAQRHDLEDQSQSGYDLALADFGMDTGIPSSRSWI